MGRFDYGSCWRCGRDAAIMKNGRVHTRHRCREKDLYPRAWKRAAPERAALRRAAVANHMCQQCQRPPGVPCGSRRGERVGPHVVRVWSAENAARKTGDGSVP